MVHELRPVDEIQLMELSTMAKASLTEYSDVAVSNVCFVRPGAVLRSTSGKIRRVHMRELFMSGELDAHFEDLDAAVRAQYRSSLLGTGSTV